jgi:hypothetical protein
VALPVPTVYQRACLSLNENINLLLCGGRGGGKSILALMALVQHASTYGQLCKALYVRETYDALVQIEQEFEALLGELYPKPHVVQHNKTDGTFTFPNGATVTFGQISERKHYVKFQGRSFSMIVCDEYGAVSQPKWINLLFSNIRGPEEVPKRVILAANPGGAQHGNLDKNYIRQAPAWHMYEKDGETWMNCPSTWRDNPNIDQEAYLRKLKASCGNDEALFKAWDTGDWNISRGAFFGGTLDERVHMLSNERFPVQKLGKEWRPYLAMDWGSGAPSVTYVVAQSPGVDGFPKDSLILVDELATHAKDDLTVGLGWSPEKLCEAVLEMANKWGCPPEGVGDEAYGLQETLLEKLADNGLYLVRPRKERVAGWQLMLNMLNEAKQRTGQPGLWISARCRYFWDTAPDIERDENRMEDILTTGPDHGVDACFVAGTQVLTPQGEVSIESLRPGDEVMTRQGAKKIRVTGARIMPTMIVQMSNGRKLQGTPEHPFFVNGQWKPLDSLRYADMLTSCQQSILSNSTESLTADTQNPQNWNCETTTPLTELSLKQVDDGCTKRSGFTTMGQSQKTITCTIRTKTLLTTTSPTLNACPDPNICPSICKAKSAKKLQDSTWGQHELRPLLGTGQKQVSLGIAKTENSHGPTEKIPKQHASTVALSTLKSFPENIVQTNANPRLVALPELTTKTETAQSVAQDSESTDTPRLAPAGVSVVSVDSAESSLVYNLQVEDCPEYFANGVLVHNCRYACMHRGHGAFTTKTTGQY